jgi:hypothetical protein
VLSQKLMKICISGKIFFGTWLCYRGSV